MNKLKRYLFSFLLVSSVFTSYNVVKAINNIDSLSVDNIDSVPINKSIINYSTEHRPGYSMTPKYITVHNTSNPDYGADAEMHSRYLQMGNTDETSVSWHYTVDNNEIYQHLPLNEVGYHAGDGQGEGNFASIGIEICENADGNYAQAEQNAIKLIAEILYEKDMDISSIVPHQHWSGKDCPHNLLSGLDGSVGWETFISQIKIEYKKIIIRNSTVEKNEIKTTVNSISKFITVSDNEAKNYDFVKNGKIINIKESNDSYNNILNNEGDYYLYKGVIDNNGLELNADIKLDELNIDNFIENKDKTGLTAESSDTNIIEIINGKIIVKNNGISFLTLKQNDKSIEIMIKTELKKQTRIIIKNEIVKTIEDVVPLLTTKAETTKTVWSSSDEDIVSIDDKGYFSTHNEGIATIKADNDGVITEQIINVEK